MQTFAILLLVLPVEITIAFFFHSHPPMLVILLLDVFPH